MSVYDESGLTVDLTDKDHFRFANLPTYRSLSSQNMKEMDFVFLNDNRLYFLEVKSFEQFITHRQGQTWEDCLKKLKVDLPKTVTDALLILCAVWLGTSEGAKLKEDGIPNAIRSFQPFTLLLSVDLPPPLDQHMGVLNTTINAALAGYAKLYAAQVLFIDYARLVEQFPFIHRTA